MATKAKPAETTENIEESALKELFVDELKDIYWAEKHLTKAIAKMAKAATSDTLRDALTNHKSETDNQISRLEQVFEIVEEKASAKKCDAMAGLIEESEGIVEDTEDGTLTRDVGIISAAQKCKHYEIASYGTLRTLASTLGYADAAKLLEETLAEEKKTDDLLSKIAESTINPKAKKEKK